MAGNEKINQKRESRVIYLEIRSEENLRKLYGWEIALDKEIADDKAKLERKQKIHGWIYQKILQLEKSPEIKLYGENKDD